VSKFATKKEIEKLKQQYGGKITLLNIRIQTIIRHFSVKPGPLLFTFEGVEKKEDEDKIHKVQDINNEDEIFLIEEDGETKVQIKNHIYDTVKEGNHFKIPDLHVPNTNGEKSEILDLLDYQKDTHNPTITRYIKKSVVGGKSRRRPARRNTKNAKRKNRRSRKRA
jgi:hypothetical protein